MTRIFVNNLVNHMKTFFIFLVILIISHEGRAAKYVVNQVPQNGSQLVLNLNVGDSVVFNLSASISVRQVSESTFSSSGAGLMTGGFFISGSGTVAITAPGPHYFVMISPAGLVSKGSVTTSTATSKSVFTPVENPVEAIIVNDRLHISIKTQNPTGSIIIHDILGNRILETSANEEKSISMAGHKSGVYFIVWRDNKISYTKRILYRTDN